MLEGPIGQIGDLVLRGMDRTASDDSCMLEHLVLDANLLEGVYTSLAQYQIYGPALGDDLLP